MINDNWDLFYKSHQTKDLLIVDIDATVTEVSGEPPTVTGATIEIHTEDLALESFTLDESLCSEDNLKFGLCEASKVSFNILNTKDIPNLKDTDYSKMLNVYLYFNNDSSTLMQIGQYICDRDQKTIDKTEREIEFYDVLYDLWDFDITEWYYGLWSNRDTITIKDFRDSLFTYLGNEYDYPITQATADLILDTKSVCKNIESDVITFGFIMGGLLEVNGVFGHINREGKFDYISLASYDTASVAEITDDFRQPPTAYEDYTTWGIGYVIAYDQNNIQIGKQGSSDKKRPSNYVIIDNWVYNSFKLGPLPQIILPSTINRLQQKIVHTKYKPSEIETVGNPCIEVGDKIDVVYRTKAGKRHSFYTYVLERHLKGLGTMKDTFTARGDKKLPNYQIENPNWHEGDSQDSATTGSGTGGVSSLDDEDSRKFCEIIRNIGFRLLDEPSNVSVVYNKTNGQIEVKWTDPSDISDYKPVPVEWAGTVLVRSENNPPLHIWDGTILVDSTTRDTYSSNAYVDNTIDQNKRYYYGIFPYHIALDDASHPIKHYRFTKVMSVDTSYFLQASTIESLEVSNVTVTVTYDIPQISGTYSYCTLVVKKNSIPADVNDGETITLNASLDTVDVTGLDAESKYYFVIFTADTDGNTASSDPKDITTGVLTELILYDATGSTVYIDPRIDDNSKWELKGEKNDGKGYMGIQDGYLGMSRADNHHNWMTTLTKFAKGGWTYICVTGEIREHYGSVITNGAFVAVMDEKPTVYYPDIQNSSHTPTQSSTLQEITTQRLDISNLSFDDFHVVIYGANDLYKVYKIWLE